MRPIMLGIVGDSAAGKATLTAGIVALLGADRVSHLCTDDYHKYDRRERALRRITPLHPDCNYLDILEQHLELLHSGQAILKPTYDHRDGSFGRPVYLEPREFVVVEGLLAFYTAGLRRFYDVMVYLAPPEELRRVWKIRRDTRQRGYTVEEVLASLRSRERDSAAFIRPQRRHADIVVRFSPPPGVPPEQAGTCLNVSLLLRPSIPQPDLSYLLSAAHHMGSGIWLRQCYENGETIEQLEIDGGLGEEHARRLEQAIWQQVPELRPLGAEQFGDYQSESGVLHSQPLALTQLLITYHLLRKQSTLRNTIGSPHWC